MCIALPVRVTEVVDAARGIVAVVPGHGVAADRGGREEVSAVLIAGDAAALDGLVGCWGLVHAGFLMQVIDEGDALERLAVFATMDEEVGAFG